MDILLNKVVLSLLLVYAVIAASVAFPQDIEPKRQFDVKATSQFPVFVGKGPGGNAGELSDVQQVTVIEDKVIISARNSIYLFEPQSFNHTGSQISFKQVVRWYPQNDTRCHQKTEDIRNCQNYIRVVTPISANSVLVCGTNSAKPTCREYRWYDGTFNQRYDEIPGIERFKVPYDDSTQFSYIYSGGYIFSALRIDLLRSNPSVARSPVTDSNNPFTGSSSLVGSNTPLPRLTTDESIRSLRDPQFVGMVDTMEKIFLFFREEAIEASDDTDKVVYSRVAQVCKNDEGGTSSLLRNKWTSFFKARLNCSIPGDRPFYFNEIQHVTQPIDLNGKMTIFATMTTPENSIPGSAVCAYTMYSIATAMAGNFKEHSRTSGCWNKNSPNTPRPHPALCNSQPVRVPVELKFIKEHTIMSESVQPLGGGAFFTRTQTQARFTVVAADTKLDLPNLSNASMIYIGTDQGTVLKVVTFGLESSRLRKTHFLEELFVYRASVCQKEGTQAKDSTNNGMNNNARNPKRVLSITMIPGNDVILVAFQHCVISVPKQLCKSYTCKGSCIQSGNPYCGWRNGECIAITADSSNDFEQDLFSTRTDLSDCDQDLNASLNIGDCCVGTAGAVLPLVVGLVSVFTFVLLIYLIFAKCKGNRRLRRTRRNCTTSLCQRRNGESSKDPAGQETRSRRFFQRKSKKDYPPRVSIEPSSAGTRPSLRSNDSVFEGAHEPLNNAANAYPNPEYSNLHIVENLTRTGQDSEGESAWSEDHFESDNPSSSQLTSPTTNQATLNSQYNMNNNRAIGVAHMMNRKSSGRISQVVRPTFISKPRVKMGSHHHGTEGYGSTNEQQHPRRSSTPPRIVTNPNYLPISPFVKRTTVPDLYDNHNFLPSDEHDYENIEGSTIQRDDFPPPPPCARSPSTAEVTSPSTMKTFNTLPISSSWFPSPPEVNETSMAKRRPSELRETTPLTQTHKLPASERAHVISSSTSGDSTSSGFVSSSFSSPPSSLKEKPGSSRKAFIVAKGILTAQSFVSSKGSKKSRKKKDSPENNVLKYSLSEQEEDSVFALEETEAENADASSQSLEHDEDNYINNFRSPEFNDGSSEEGFSENSPTTPSDRLTPSPAKSKPKKCNRLFKLKKNKRNKKDKNQGMLMPDVETFISPAYDEDPVIPTVVGWKEIEYSSPAANYEHDNRDATNSSFQSPEENDRSKFNARSFDDSYLPRDSNLPPSQPYAFYTMRPKHRMRQSMPKMRNTDKSWARTNNPLPVPTPAVPDVI